MVAGKGKLTHTGQLGEVMQESIQAAMTVVRSRSAMLGLEADFYQKADVHIHVPEGATTEGRAERGCGDVHLADFRAHQDSGAIGRGHDRRDHAARRRLPIGGLKEKLLAAHRGGITTVLIPDENTKDLAEIPDNIKEKLDIRPVKWIDEGAASGIDAYAGAPGAPEVKAPRPSPERSAAASRRG